MMKEVYWIGYRVLTYKNLIYLLNLQFYCVNTSYPMDNMLNNYRLVGG